MVNIQCEYLNYSLKNKDNSAIKLPSTNKAQILTNISGRDTLVIFILEKQHKYVRLLIINHNHLKFLYN